MITSFHTKSFFVPIQLTLLIVSLSLPFSFRADAQVSSGTGSSTQIQVDNLIDSLTSTIASEGQENTQLEERLKQLQRSVKTSDTEINAYKVQISTFSNMLHQDIISIEDLKKARAALENSLQNITLQLKDLNTALEEVGKLQKEATDQFTFNKEQLAKSKPNVSEHAKGKVILDQLKTLDKVLAEKLTIISDLESLYSKQISQFEEVRKSILNLAASFDQQIEEKQKQVLFDRTQNPLITLDWQRIPEEANKIFGEIRQLFALEFWREQIRYVWKSGGLLLIKALLLFLITQLLLMHLRKFCIKMLGTLQNQKPWLCFSLDLFRRSLFLSGTVLFIYIYATLQDLFSGIPFTAVIVNMLFTWLLTGWFLDFLKLLKRSKKEWIPEKLRTRLRFLLRAIRLTAIPYLALQWTLGSSSNFLMLVRVIFGILFIIWSMNFWREFRLLANGSGPTSWRYFQSVRNSLIGWGYTVSVGGLTLELFGYGQLSIYWYASWSRTLGVVLWGTLLFFVLREWDQAILSVPISDRKGSHHLRWLLIRLLWASWAGVFSVFLLLAWGARKAVVLGFFQILNQSISLGEIHFNLLGIAYAFLILALTLAASRVWRQILKKKVLAKSGLEIGLQESVTTLSVYVLWVMGFLAALHAVGVGTTSLAVAFGALGIGLGFGLQNIFNNFLSGIILLFERPIQVGEVIEIGGKWGTVRQINFRSTVVQTYDNASLIIPNSDFISSQVINWSFKDPRVRRTIAIGVAYGTDPVLVRETLLEIAEQHPQVLKYPKYDVLFFDFGDSALIFHLRFWSTLNDFLQVETDIRFEIDKHFRERKIEIPFPQRDIHIRSGAQDSGSEAQTAKKDNEDQ